MLNDCSCEKVKIWTKDMLYLSISNLFLYLSLYILLPVLPKWIADSFNCSYVESAGIVSVFAISVFVSGPFNSYMIDAFKRKNVGFWAFVFLGLSSLVYPFATVLIYILFLRIIQGILFGIVIMSTGSTLLIDITPSKCRTNANIWFTRMGRIGMCLGLAIGIWMNGFYNIDYILYISAGVAVLSGFMVLMINVPFRAPLKPSLCSFDRFLLPRTFPVALNLIFLASTFGLLITSVKDYLFYIVVMLGFIFAFIISKTLLKQLGDRFQISLGSLLIVISFLLLLFVNANGIAYSSAFLYGIGLALTSIRFYVMIINLPLHCERGSANNTYYLMWEVGVGLGFFIGYLFNNLGTSFSYILILMMCVIYFLLYELVIRKWYIRKIENQN